MFVRPINESDSAAWIAMRTKLWPEDAGEHARDAARFFAGESHEPLEVLIATNPAGEILGFAELSIRNVVDGCSSDRVAYLEGWFVEESARRSGVGRALIIASEAWGRKQGCREFGSDSEIENDVSIAAHRALGFEETDRVVCFRKDLV